MNESSAKGQRQDILDCPENADSLQRIAQQMKALHNAAGDEAMPARFKELLEALDEAERDQGGDETPTRRS